MKEEIRRMNPDSEFFTPELCYINELSNSADDPEASIARARVKTGVTTRWHRLHGITERYLILDGEGLVEIGDLAPQEVKHGDVVLIRLCMFIDSILLNTVNNARDSYTLYFWLSARLSDKKPTKT